MPGIGIHHDGTSEFHKGENLPGHPGDCYETGQGTVQRSTDTVSGDRMIDIAWKHYHVGVFVTGWPVIGRKLSE
jgi:hypothetical protein